MTQCMVQLFAWNSITAVPKETHRFLTGTTPTTSNISKLAPSRSPSQDVTCLPAAPEPPIGNTRKYNPTERDKHASAPGGACKSIGRSHSAKLGYRLSAVSSSLHKHKKECGASVRPLRVHRLRCGYSTSYPPMTDKPPEAGGAGTPGVRYRACIPCIHSSYMIGMGVYFLYHSTNHCMYILHLKRLPSFLSIFTICVSIFLFLLRFFLIVCIHRERRSGGILCGW